MHIRNQKTVYKEKHFSTVYHSLFELEKSEIMRKFYMMADLLEYFRHAGAKALTLVICYYFYCI